jgi:hypothetical protein
MPSDFGHSGIGELAVSMPRAMRYPALAAHIIMVLLRCSEKQVPRVNAHCIVAVMEHPKPLRDGAEVNLP